MAPHLGGGGVNMPPLDFLRNWKSDFLKILSVDAESRPSSMLKIRLGVVELVFEKFRKN